MEYIHIFTELLHKCTSSQVICIHGKSATGKTTVAQQLCRSLQYPVFHTDDYKHLGWEQSLYGLMNDLGERGSVPCIIEGIQIPRLIRKGFKADLIIETVCDPELRIRRYHQRGEGVKVPNLAQFDSILGKIWRECKVLCPQVQYNTDPIE